MKRHTTQHNKKHIKDNTTETIKNTQNNTNDTKKDRTYHYYHLYHYLFKNHSKYELLRCYSVSDVDFMSSISKYHIFLQYVTFRTSLGEVRLACTKRIICVFYFSKDCLSIGYVRLRIAYPSPRAMVLSVFDNCKQSITV